ncbi:MAG: hypothetical protein KDI14_00465 [Halioglobus sp.]|nr:hypothetical protein [Halioglobus sp.]
MELVSERVLGQENSRYVRNIIKYWVAYRLIADLEREAGSIQHPQDSPPTARARQSAP